MKRSLTTSTALLTALLAVLIIGGTLAPVAWGAGTSSTTASPSAISVEALQLPTLEQVQQHQGIPSAPVAMLTRAMAQLSTSAQLPTHGRTLQHQGVATQPATPATAELAAAYADHLWTSRPTIGLFARDALLHDRGYGDLRVGANAIAKYQQYWSKVLTFAPYSQLAGSDAVVVENAAAGFLSSVDVLRVQDGKIVASYIYYNDLQRSPGNNLPAPLETSPGLGDTEGSSGAMAREYMAALRALDPARLAVLYGDEVVYQDTGRDERHEGPTDAAVEHAGMFVLKGVRFQANGVVNGPGWAAVMWQRTDREGGKPLVDIPAKFTKAAMRPTVHGVSILEIRDGRIIRETIYSDHLRTWY